MRGDTARLSRTWPRAHARSPVRDARRREKKRKRVESGRVSGGGGRVGARGEWESEPSLLYFGKVKKKRKNLRCEKERVMGNRVKRENETCITRNRVFLKSVTLRKARNRENGACKIPRPSHIPSYSRFFSR